MTIDAYVEAIKERFLTDPFVTQFQVIRERSTLMDGYLRARLALADGSQLELSEYMQRSSGLDHGIGPPMPFRPTPRRVVMD